MRSAARALAASALAAVLVVVPALGARASAGSVPPEVRAYVTGGGLVDRLEDIYGENAQGAGIAFDETTTPGPISRVFHWTDERIAGDTDGKPTRMVNEWAVPVSLGEEPVGVAIVWINTDTELPELAEFDERADAALALQTVPDAAQLVRDMVSSAWFALEDGTVTPLVAGTSGVTGPTPVDELVIATPAPDPETPGDPGTGLGVAIAVVVLLLGVVVAALLLPGRRRREV
ncbi:hypothetical protein [Protaetiibacter intestinalis]|uniref:Uncharacterized protein n=1 Tax=Protaetiibacter intestinalis TaxID=2419774 RepID=A0A387B8L7_9MICO|nr:hypothetical protein [Protaetiibacter intestinalis]AYF98171.1 hypothetical protein D7I47_07840 [Protaetiibacter intestinalis]